jgi:hypothetical protein
VGLAKTARPRAPAELFVRRGITDPWEAEPVTTRGFGVFLGILGGFLATGERLTAFFLRFTNTNTHPKIEN